VVQQLLADSAVRQVATVRLQPDANAVGHMSSTATSLVMQRHHVVLLTECRVAGDKTQHAHVVEDIIATPSRCALQHRVYLPRGHLSGLETHCKLLDLEL
jgi:hypothetical protein